MAYVRECRQGNSEGKDKHMGMRETKRLLGRGLAAVALSAFCVCGAAPASESQAEWNGDLDFLVRLGQERFDFYADMQLKLMARKYQDRKDDLKLANAIYYFSIRKAGEAEKHLAAFKKGHPLYTQTLYLRGTKYAELRQFPQAEKNFREYFSLIPEAPSGKRAKKDYVTGLQYFIQVLKEQGKGDEAAKYIDRMPPDDSLGERELTYLKQLSRIEAEEAKLAAGKGVDGKVLGNAMSELKSLLFVRDGIGALAAIQVARIQCLQGENALKAAKGDANKIKGIRNFTAAIQTIKQFEDYFQEIEDQNSRETSPMPEGLFYKAQAIRGLAEVTAAGGNLKLAEKQLAKGAVTYFKMIQKRYPKSAVVRKLPRQYLLCEEANARWKLNAKLDLPKASSSDMAAVFEPAVLLWRDQKNYKGAAERYRELLKKHSKNPGVIPHVPGFMQCLAMLDQYDEGKAVIEQLAKTFPDERSGIGRAALTLGAYADKRMKEAPKGKPNPHKAKQEQLYFWARNLFVDYDPGHPQAAAVAYDLAVSKFNAGVSALREAEKKAADQRPAAVKAAKAKLKEAVPLFRRVATVFSLDPKGKAALMKVGQLCLMADERDLAIDAFRRFLAVDDGSLERADVLEAQFRLGDLLYFAGRYAEAREHYEKVRAMTEAGQPYANVRNAEAFRERAVAYIPITMDRESNLISTQIAVLEERAAKLGNDSYDLEIQARAFAKRLKDLPALTQAIAERRDEMKRVLGSLELDYRKAARAQAKAEAAKPNAPKTEEEFYQIFLKGVEDAARTVVATEREAIATRLKACDEQKAAAEDAIRRGQAQLAALDKATKAQKAAIDKAKARVAELNQAFQTAEKNLADAQAKQSRLQNTLQSSTDDDEIKRAREELKALEAKLAELENTRATVVSVAAKQEVVRCERDIQANEAAIAENIWKAGMVRSDIELAQLDVKAADSERAPLESRSQFIEKVAAVLDGPEAARLKAAPAIRKGIDETVAQIEQASTAEAAALAELTKRLDAGVKRCQARKAELEKQQRETTEAIKPLDREWRSWKDKAIAGYRAYVRAYAKGRYVNQCTTALAGALVDQNQFAEAVSQLNSLLRLPECSDAPGNAKCDPTQTVDVLYQLAKAQTRAKQLSAAAGTYGRLMGSQHEGVRKAVAAMPVGNLFFIADQGLDVGAPAAALQACELLLARIAASRTEAAQLRPALIEKVYIQGARAALKAGDAAKALSLVQALLQRNAKTAFLYEARFLEAEALVVQGKVDEGIGMLNLLLRRVSDVALSNRIRCEIARLFLVAAARKPDYRASAASIYDSIIAFAKESADLDAAWTASPEAKANAPWIDTAFLEAAKLLRADGKADKLAETKALYRRLFPNGAKTAELNALN